MRRALFATTLTLALAASSRARAQNAPPTAPAPTAPTAPSAAPPTAAGTTGLQVTPGLEVFAQYALRLTNTAPGDTAWFHAFDLTRAHASVTATYGPVRGRFVLEAVRSASEGALLGVAGDSLVLRVREAWAGWTPRAWFELQAGVVPTLSIPEIEGTWRLRAVAPTPLEVTALASPADLGATARVRLPRGYGWVGVGAYNGEGYTNRELNRGKNIEVAASIHPAPGGALAPLAIFASYVNGSSGTGLARADRVSGAVLWQGERLRAGVSFTWAMGVEDDSARTSWLAEGFVRAEPVRRLLLGARVSYWQRDTREATDRVTTLLATVGWRVLDPLEFFVALNRSIPGARAVQALPAMDNWEFRVVGRVVF